jgi:hypothetical protein
MAAKNERGAQTLSSLVSLKNGTIAALSSKSKLEFGGKTWTREELLGVVTSYIGKYEDVETARHDLKLKIERRDAVHDEAKTFVSKMSKSLLVKLDADSASLAKFGLTAPKPPRKLTGQEILAKAQKARATRHARKTLGSRQKLAIKGVDGAVPPAPTNTIVVADASAPKEANGVSH